jgi:hypothetical protein
MTVRNPQSWLDPAHAARHGSGRGWEETTMRRDLIKQSVIMRSVMSWFIAAAAGMWATAAWPANIFELNFWMSGPRYDNVVPLCTEHGPLDHIVAHWGTKEYRFWNSDLELVGFENIRELGLEPWRSGPLPRRFCTASVLVSDGKRRQIYYSIAEDTGMLGVTYGVEFCVVGLDRDWAYNPRCQMARP